MDELRLRRQAKSEAGRRDGITKLLSDLYIGHVEDRYEEEGELKGILIVRFFESGPVVNSAGVKLSEYHKAAAAITHTKQERWLDSLGPGKPQGAHQGVDKQGE